MKRKEALGGDMGQKGERWDKAQFESFSPNGPIHPCFPAIGLVHPFQALACKERKLIARGTKFYY